jgi:hypothetical protein
MQQPNNITAFQEMTGRVLGHLYDRHPTAIFFDYESFFEEPFDDNEEDLFNDTVMYLIENGYLTQTDKDTHVRLNDRSYQVLQKPNPLSAEEPIGTTLAHWARETASDTGKSIISGAANAALSMLYTSIKNGVL